MAVYRPSRSGPIDAPVPGPVLGPMLGIETSCDETACAVLSPSGAVLAEAVHSQAAHAAYGGVVPEIAARAHLAILPGLAARVLADAGMSFRDLGGVAATAGPGLIGGLIVGASYAKGVALAAGAPFWAVNHLEAHALTARLPGLGFSPAFPYVLLLVSGGHCQLLRVRGVGDYARLGGTLDDAVGEAFDKVAKLLGLGWPGGPALERLAAEGRADAHRFPRPMLGRAGCDFSFSGLKTAVALAVGAMPGGALPRQTAADLAASFQAAAADILADRARHALAMTGDRTLVVAGGVASNATVRAALAGVCAGSGGHMLAPPGKYCTDNAVMVAWAAIERARAGFAPDPLDAPPRPRWPLAGAEAGAAG